MRTIITAGLVTATLFLGACGSSDGGSNDGGSSDGGSSSASGDQGRVADLLLSAAADEGFELDADCVNENVSELTDEDAKALADSGLEGNPEVSAAADAIGETIFSECVDAASYLDALIASFGESDPTLDTECLASALEGKTVDEIDDELFDAALSCSPEG